MVCGHDTLMRIMDYMHDKGLSPDHFKFLATNKVFGFGGDASRKADWSVRLPCFIKGLGGYMECFIVEGATPLLIGRPILKALKIRVDYDTEKMSIRDGQWDPVVTGEKGEYLLQLDDDLPTNLDDYVTHFDYVTDDSYNALTNEEDLATYVSVHDYLATTGRDPPETALFNAECTEEEVGSPSPAPDDTTEGEDDTGVRKPITDKLIRTMKLQFNMNLTHRRDTVEQALSAHDNGRRLFWEVYSGSGQLSDEMEQHGWEVQRFDYNTGWDFEDPLHRREFLHLLNLLCPEFVWYAPPCTVWSPLQNLNMDTPERYDALMADRDYQETTHLRFCYKGYAKQLREHRHAALEQPRYAVSWKTKTFMKLPGYDAHLDQCQYGCCLPDENGVLQFIKKPTTVRCTDDWMAFGLTRMCAEEHFHLPIEGSSPGIGSRAEAAGVYQPSFCQEIRKEINSLMSREHERVYAGEEDPGEHPVVPDQADDEDDIPNLPAGHAEVPGGARQAGRGVLQRLHQPGKLQAERTVMRLHRNLGHPTRQELVRLLSEKQSDPALITAAENLTCAICDVHRPPVGVPVSSMPRSTAFNQRVQADTLCIQVPGQRRQQPVLMISDSSTRLLAARHLHGGELSKEFLKQLERAWIRHFGPMQILAVDEHRAWSSDQIREWCTEQGIQLQISLGQSHTRLPILERRHQVTRRAVSLFLQSNPTFASQPDGLITALNYVVPQINRTPNVCGYSPIQWAIGYTPHVPGLLMEEPEVPNPSHLQPSEQFMEKLRLQQEAGKATMQADVDRRLRRALLRKFMGQQCTLRAGDLCFYWRDAPAGSAAKLRWRGPATVVMREEGARGPTTDVYWIAHGTSLLRAAPEHVKPATMRPHEEAEQPQDPLQRARDALQAVQSGSDYLHRPATLQQAGSQPGGQ